MITIGWITFGGFLWGLFGGPFPDWWEGGPPTPPEWWDPEECDL